MNLRYRYTVLRSVGSLICCGFYVYTDVSKKNKNRKWQRILRTMHFNIKKYLGLSVGCKYLFLASKQFKNDAGFK